MTSERGATAFAHLIMMRDSIVTRLSDAVVILYRTSGPLDT